MMPQATDLRMKRQGSAQRAGVESGGTSWGNLGAQIDSQRTGDYTSNGYVRFQYIYRLALVALDTEVESFNRGWDEVALKDLLRTRLGISGNGKANIRSCLHIKTTRVDIKKRHLADNN